MSTVVSRFHDAVTKPASELLTTRVILELGDARELLAEITRLCDEHGACMCGHVHCDRHEIGDAVPCVLKDDIHCVSCVGSCVACMDELAEQRATDQAINDRRERRND